MCLFSSSILRFYDAMGILLSKEKRKIEKEQRIADLLLLQSVVQVFRLNCDSKGILFACFSEHSCRVAPFSLIVQISY